MFSKPPTATDPASDELRTEVAALRSECGALHRRLSNVESLLVGLYGPGALGGGSRPVAAEPEATMPRLRPVADLPGSNGAVVTVAR
jgi:hypothetical protein